MHFQAPTPGIVLSSSTARKQEWHNFIPLKKKNSQLRSLLLWRLKASGMAKTSSVPWPTCHATELMTSPPCPPPSTTGDRVTKCKIHCRASKKAGSPGNVPWPGKVLTDLAGDSSEGGLQLSARVDPPGFKDIKFPKSSW